MSNVLISESGEGAFGPVAEGALRLPFAPDEGFALSETAEQALEAVARLQGASVLALACWKEEAPFWHAPVILLAICRDDSVELFDLVKLRTCSLHGWAEASNQIRMILSDVNNFQNPFFSGISGWATLSPLVLFASHFLRISCTMPPSGIRIC